MKTIGWPLNLLRPTLDKLPEGDCIVLPAQISEYLFDFTAAMVK